MKTKAGLVLILLFCSLQFYLNAQHVNSLYFLENVPVRHFQNPAFTPTNGVYISPPVIGLTQFELGDNSISFSDILYNNNFGTTNTFLGNLTDFHSLLKYNLISNVDFQTNLVGFGFRHNSEYWTFSMTDKLNSFLSVPKSFFDISIFGSTKSDQYVFSNVKFDITKYTELAFGFSKPINQRLTFGSKLKINLGTANLSNINNGFVITPQNDLLNFNGSGTLNVSGFLSSPNTINLQHFRQSYKNFLSPEGIGLGFDVGLQYQLNEKFNLSAALLDVGYIAWSKSPINYKYSIVDYNAPAIESYNQQGSSNLYDAFETIINGTNFDESLVSAFELGSVPDSTTSTYFTSTKMKFNFGLQYKLIDDYLSIGMLSSTQIFRGMFEQELTISAITKPKDWVNATLSYSFVGGRNSIGAGFGLRTGIFHWFITADYIPFSIYSISNVSFQNSDLVIPYKSKMLNLALGMNLVFKSVKTHNTANGCKVNQISGLNYSDTKPAHTLRKGVTKKTKLYKKN